MTYDARLHQLRLIRGNRRPSMEIRLLGRDTSSERWQDGQQAWLEKEARVLELIAEQDPKALWIDPKLELDSLPQGSFSTGNLPLRRDLDGVVRTIELANSDGLSPALELYAKLKGVNLADLRIEDQTVSIGYEVLPRVLAVDFPLHQREVQGAVRYMGLSPTPLANLVEPEILAALEGRAVLVAEATMAARHDFKTPEGELEPFQLEFAALDTLLSGWVLEKLPFAWELLLVTVLVTAAAGLAFFTSNTWFVGVIWLGIVAVYWRLAVHAFVEGLWLPVAPVVGGSLISMALVSFFQKKFAETLLSRMLGQERARTAAQGEVALGGTERTVTILFTNLPKSIKELEKTDPEESIRARNRYNALTTQVVVRDNQGWVLDYQGDAQMVGFGVERLDDQHAFRATKAGLELIEVLRRHYPEESIHCGVCTGPAAVGLVGAPGAKALAAIGDTTNVAARLMGAAKKQGVDVLISEPTHALCHQKLKARQLPAVSLKGKTSQVKVYAAEEILSCRDD